MSILVNITTARRALPGSGLRPGLNAGSCAVICLLTVLLGVPVAQTAPASDETVPNRVIPAEPAPMQSATGDSSLTQEGADQQQNPPTPQAFRLYAVQGDDLLERIWGYVGRSGEPEAGEYQVLLVNDTILRGWLLREGTQVGELPDWTLDWVQTQVRSSVSTTDGEGTRSLTTGLWANFWNPQDRLAPYQWPTGLEVDFRHEIGVFRSSTPMLGQHYDITLVQRPETWLVTEIGAHMSRHGGGLRRNLFNPLDDRTDWEPWGSHIGWWHAAIGVPGVKWEIALANRVFPEYYWLEPNAAKATFKNGMERKGLALDTTVLYNDGSVMRHWNDTGGNPKPKTGNLAQTLHLKAGQLRYSAHFDRDVYRSTIHTFMFEEIAAPFGQWALGFVSAKGASHSRLRLDMFQWQRGLGSAATDASLRAFFLSVHLDYRDPGTYRFAVSTKLLLDGRYLRPGDTP